MIDIGALAWLCKLANEGGDKVLEQYKKRKFSEAEKKLLIAAAKNGEFRVMSADGVPNWIMVGGKTFPQDITGDPANFAKYSDAFENLCRRAFIRYDGGDLFRLTDAGFEKSRQLASKSDKKKANKH
jgi:hypothetical protein